MKDKRQLTKIFKSIYAIDSILLRFTKGKIQDQDWRRIIISIQTMMELRRSLPQVNVPRIIVDFVQHQQWPIINQLINKIRATVQITPFAVKSQFDEELSYQRKLNLQIPFILVELTKSQRWSIPAKIIFIHQQGYLIEVPHDVKRIPQNYLLQWQQQYSNGFAKYFTSQLTAKLNQQYGDVTARIKDIQSQILFDLQQSITQMEIFLVDLYWKAARIQCFWTISQIGKNMALPQLSSEQMIIINGWNLLLQENAVDNHVFSFHHEKGPKQKVYNSQQNLVNTNYSNRLTIVSGPNGAGKTIYMKQLGVIVYLAHCGFYVPAAFAQIPLVDRIVVVGTNAYLHSKQAGFEKQLYSLSKIINKGILTNKSMVFIDEIGLSRDYTIALKLLYACVQYLSQNQDDRFRSNKVLTKSTDNFRIPFSMIITHLTMLMTNQLIVQNYYTRFLMMDVNNDFDFLFKIKPGLVRSGYGIKSAQDYLKNQQLLKNALIYWNKIKQ